MGLAVCVCELQLRSGSEIRLSARPCPVALPHTAFPTISVDPPTEKVQEQGQLSLIQPLPSPAYRTQPRQHYHLGMITPYLPDGTKDSIVRGQMMRSDESDVEPDGLGR